MERIQYFSFKYLEDLEILQSVCWALSHYLEPGPRFYDRLQKVHELTIVKMISQVLDQEVNMNVKHSIIRMLSKMSMASMTIISSFCDKDFAQILSKFLGATQKDVRYVTAWTISNLILTDYIIYEYFYNFQLVDYLISKIQIENNIRVKTQFLDLLCTFIIHGKTKNLEEIIFEHEIINWLLLWLNDTSNEIDIICLKGLEHLLEQGELKRVANDRNEIAYKILHHEYFDNLMKAKESPNEDVYALASKITEQYFGSVISLF